MKAWTKKDGETYKQYKDGGSRRDTNAVQFEFTLKEAIPEEEDLYL
jgi:hypothetical protein